MSIGKMLDFLFKTKELERIRALGIKTCNDCYFYSEYKGYYGYCRRDNTPLLSNMAQICGYWTGEEEISEAKGFATTETIKAKGMTTEKDKLKGEDNTEVNWAGDNYELRKTVAMTMLSEDNNLDSVLYEERKTGTYNPWLKITVQNLGQSEETVEEHQVTNTDYQIRHIQLSKAYYAKEVKVRLYMKSDGTTGLYNKYFKQYGIIVTRIEYY